MIITRKDKVWATIIVVLFISAWIVLGYFTKSGAFHIFADTVRNPEVLTK